MKCTCLISIIYMTERFSVLDQAGKEEAIERGKAFVEEADRLEESYIKALQARVVAERMMPEQLNMI